MLVVVPGQRADDRRAAARARRRRGRPRGTDVDDPDLGRDRRPVSTVVDRDSLLGPTGHAGPRDRGLATRSGPGTCCDSRRRSRPRRFEPRVAGPARAADDQGRRRDRAAATGGPGGRPGRRADRRRRAGRADRGRRRPRGPRAAHRRGPRRGAVRDRRLRAELARRPITRRRERVIRAGEPIVLDIGGHARRLRLGHHPDAVGHRRRPGERARTSAFRHLFGVLYGGPGRGDRARSDPGVACEAIDATARRPIDAEGYGEAFFHRTGHGIGLEGHEDPYLVAGNDAAAARAGMAFSVEPGIYLVGRVRRPHRGHRRVRPGRADRAQRGASRAATSSTADTGTPLAGLEARLRYHRSTDRPDRSAKSPSTDDQPPTAPLRRRSPRTGTPNPAATGSMSRRHGRTHHHDRGAPRRPASGGAAGPRRAGRPMARKARSHRRRSPPSGTRRPARDRPRQPRPRRRARRRRRPPRPR